MAHDQSGGSRSISTRPGRSQKEETNADGRGVEWPVFAAVPADALWRDVAAADPLRLPALSRYDLFRDEVRIALADQAIDPGGETGLVPGVYAAILQAASQSTLRRMADGLAGPLDATRIDRLRMLGNGVVPLQAAHAIRTLGVTLAGRTGNDPARFVWGCA